MLTIGEKDKFHFSAAAILAICPSDTLCYDAVCLSIWPSVPLSIPIQRHLFLHISKKFYSSQFETWYTTSPSFLFFLIDIRPHNWKSWPYCLSPSVRYGMSNFYPISTVLYLWMSIKIILLSDFAFPSFQFHQSFSHTSPDNNLICRQQVVVLFQVTGSKD